MVWFDSASDQRRGGEIEIDECGCFVVVVVVDDDDDDA